MGFFDRLRARPLFTSVAHICFCRGVDLVIVRADMLDDLKKKGASAKDIKKQFIYVNEFYNEEMDVIASKSVHETRASSMQEGQRPPSQRGILPKKSPRRLLPAAVEKAEFL